MELVYMYVSDAYVARLVGSSPISGTKKIRISVRKDRDFVF